MSVIEEVNEFLGLFDKELEDLAYTEIRAVELEAIKRKAQLWDRLKELKVDEEFFVGLNRGALDNIRARFPADSIRKSCTMGELLQAAIQHAITKVENKS